jgi:1-acyl-sn-glycerol-3-phosphate acyltransferase
MTKSILKDQSIFRRGFFFTYGLWCWLMLILVALTLGPLIIILPDVHRRRWLNRHAARLVLFLCGYRLRVHGLTHLPNGPCIVVANHASYLDGIVLTAALPPRFAFVIKDEMANVPLAGLLLRRIGSLFVDRSNAQGSSRDARKILQFARDGACIAFFPEGTFLPEPGLLAFKLGAFITAAKFNLPVVAITLRGTRQALRSHTWWPRPANLTVTLHPALQPLDSSRKASGHLRDLARQQILADLGEPDSHPAHPHTSSKTQALLKPIRADECADNAAMTPAPTATITQGMLPMEDESRSP